MAKRKTIIIDDDPTGCQTVRDVPVLLNWDEQLVRSCLGENDAAFILTNTRAMLPHEASLITTEVCDVLKSIALKDGYTYSIISRSDSTLRGHLSEEVGCIMKAFPDRSRLVVAPEFFECGRVTVDDVHYLCKEGKMVRVAETEFAKDPSFGYTNSDLKLWVEEVGGGRFRAVDCVSISALDCTKEQFTSSSQGNIFIVNASDYSDLDRIVSVIKEAEAEGLNFVFRTAASFVRSYLGQNDNGIVPLRKASEHGLIVVGSYTGLTTSQLEKLRRDWDIAYVELDIKTLDKAHCKSAASKIDTILESGDCLVYTSREYSQPPQGITQLEFASKLSAFICDVVSSIRNKPDFIIAKGGITSLSIAKDALGIRKTTVLGQIAPGIPVWTFGNGSYYIVFPGNVGSPATLSEIYGIICNFRDTKKLNQL